MKAAPERNCDYKIDILKKKEEIRKLEADNKQLQENLQNYQLGHTNSAELTTYEQNN